MDRKKRCPKPVINALALRDATLPLAQQCLRPLAPMDACPQKLDDATDDSNRRPVAYKANALPLSPTSPGKARCRRLFA